MKKINSNRDEFPKHWLVAHGSLGVDHDLTTVPRSFGGLRDFLQRANAQSYIEGIVFHHEDGRMVKIKTKDFAR